MRLPLSLIRLFLLWILCTGFLSAQVVVQDFPVLGQLLPRDAGGTAALDIQGLVTESGWDRAVLELYADDVLVQTDAADLSYVGSLAAFELAVTLTAGLIDYRAELVLENPSGRLGVKTADHLACGDVFFVQGQSNAVAADYWSENVANQWRSPWIRSFSTGSLSGFAVEANRNWYWAEGEASNGPGTVGSWALQIGALIVDRAQVPVAILNGAVGGTKINFHLRDDGNPMNTGTNYGRLLWRAQHSGLRDHVRAMFWYQGESNGSDASQYAAQFADLIGDWREDFPALQKVYVMQVRQGCGADDTSDIFEVQRQLAVQHPDVQLMSTTALPDHDGCHFRIGGYQSLAFDLARLMGRDFYGLPFGPEVEPPNVVQAWRSNLAGTEITVQFGPAGTLMSAENGAQFDFRLQDGVTVTSVSAQGDQLILQLNGPTNSSTLRYVGRSGGSSGWVSNQNGVGALTFEVPLM
ncbi:MAG: hypothetical protein DWQ01_19530 [Planctomycetota bacterium]|nr:MAG: hypothetical protein DWQ01_19530 [Planctomycetota bacterium]